MAKNRIEKIRLDEDETQRLVLRIEEMIEEAEEYNSRWRRLHDSYLRAYHCIPDEGNDDWPWPGASRLFLPLSRVVIDGHMAQEWDSMFSNDPFIRVRPRRSDVFADAETLTDFYSYVFTQVVPFRNVANDWMFDNDLDGTSVAKVRFDRNQHLIRRLSTENVTRTETEKFKFLGVEIPRSRTIIEPITVEEVLIERMDRPVIDNTDMARLFIAPDTTDSLQWPKCRWYYEEFDLTWEDLLERRRHGYDNIDDELKSRLAERDLTERERTNREAESLGNRSLETARVLEIYMRWPLQATVTFTDASGKSVTRDQGGIDDEEAFWEDVVVTYLADTKRISRVVPLGRISHNGKRPHVDNRFIRIPRQFYGMGLAAKMRQLQAWMNSSVNQMMDNGTLQNLPYYFYSPALTGLTPDFRGLRPGQGVEVADPRGISFPRFQGDYQFYLSAVNLIQVLSERDSGVNDLNLGRNPSTPNAPRTFRGQALMVQQSQVGFARVVSLHKENYEELFRRVDDVYVQNMPDELVVEVTGKEIRLDRRALEAPKDFEFVINPNRTAEQQAKQQMFQLILQALPTAMQNPMLARPVREASKQLYEVMGEKNFDLIWPEEMTPQIQTQGVMDKGQMPVAVGGGGDEGMMESMMGGQPDFGGLSDLLAEIRPKLEVSEEETSVSV